jgi:hypothetical protein
MLARLGNIIYWLGCIVAALVIAAGTAEWFSEAQYRTRGYGIVIGFAVAALIVWLIGRAFRYVLAGTAPRNAGGLQKNTGGLKRKAKIWRQSYVAGAANTGNITATVGDRLVLNWHGTPTQRDRVLQMFPVVRDKSMPGVELGNCADAMIASIHDDGMAPDEVGSNMQRIAMLWRIFTTPLGDGSYGDLIGYTNMHAAFELHEQPTDEFKVTWKISVMRGRTR